MGLSLWLVPTKDEEIQILKEEMKLLRNRINKGEDISEPFNPHVTLLGGLTGNPPWTAEEVWKTLLESVRKWKTFDIDNGSNQIIAGLEEVTTRGLYFQCILIALEKTTQLLSLNEHMRTSFKIDDQVEYFPHCSLLYGHLNQEKSLEYIQSLEKDPDPMFKKIKTGISFGSSNNHSRSSMKSINLGSIELWDTNGEVSEWKRLNHVNLSDI